MDENENKGIEMPPEKPKKTWEPWQFVVITVVVIVFGLCGYAMGKGAPEEESPAIVDKQAEERYYEELERIEASQKSLDAEIKKAEQIPRTRSEAEPEAEDYDVNATEFCAVGELDNAEILFGGEGEVIVYVTDSEKRYHQEGCSSLEDSKHEIGLEDAIERGYTPCKNCNPPTE